MSRACPTPKAAALPATRRQLSRMADRLVRWFRQEGRDLPWRHTRDPYAIWISEIMLQQTQVKTVIPYWLRWMERLPDIGALARVPSGQLHKLWEGLGYYSRARNLQRAAQIVIDRHQGVFPSDFDDLLALPGIGRYTAGAISSIAFHQPRPILDGNVIRVLTRFFALAGNPRDKRVHETLWEWARQLVELAARNGVSAESCSDLNQSLMELGALICSPKQPACARCPLSRQCSALADGTVDRFPQIPPRPTAVAVRFVALALSHRGRYLVRQRPAGGVNSHLWEFLNQEVSSATASLDTAARRLVDFPIDALRPLDIIRHSITRYRIALYPYTAQAASPKPAVPEGRWLTRAQIASLPFTSAHRKILEALP